MKHCIERECFGLHNNSGWLTFIKGCYIIIDRINKHFTYFYLRTGGETEFCFFIVFFFRFRFYTESMYTDRYLLVCSRYNGFQRIDSIPRSNLNSTFKIRWYMRRGTLMRINLSLFYHCCCSFSEWIIHTFESTRQFANKMKILCSSLCFLVFSSLYQFV